MKMYGLLILEEDVQKAGRRTEVAGAVQGDLRGLAKILEYPGIEARS